MKKLLIKKIFLLLSLALSINAAFSQNDILVTVQLTPPFSPYLSTYADHPEKLFFSVSNTTGFAKSLKLKIKISGDNGITASTSSNFNPSQAITLNPYEVKQINFSAGGYGGYFDANNFDLTGITKRELLQNKPLPEGNYTICVQALDYSTSQPLSGDEPMGCSSSFGIIFADPPSTSMPVCESSVSILPVQNILFNWLPAMVSGVIVNYEFTLKEIPNNTNANDVIKNPALPIIYSTVITGYTTLVYTNAMPKLDAGKKYVWRVKVIDPKNSVQFKNAGYSEACWFSYGEMLAPPISLDYSIPLEIPLNNVIMDITKSSSKTGEDDYYPFSWKAPSSYKTGVGMPLVVFRIAPVDSGMTAVQALAKDRNVKEISVEASYYHYHDIGDFVTGKTYAWEIRGSGALGAYETYKSEVRTFKVKKDYSAYKIAGRLFYSYHLPAALIQSNGGLSNPTMGTTEGENYPFANKKIYFYKAVVVMAGSSNAASSDWTQFGIKTFKDIGSFVGSATTDEQGHFTFKSGAVLGKLEEVNANGTILKYYKVLKVSLTPDLSINNPSEYFLNPDEYILVDSQKVVQQDFLARVKSFNLNVTYKEFPKKDYYNTTPPQQELPKDLTIYILRKNRYPSSSFPKHEGTSGVEEEKINIAEPNKIPNYYSVISKKNGKAGTEVKFDYLVMNDENNPSFDKLFAYAKFKDGNEIIMRPVGYKPTHLASCPKKSPEQTFLPSHDYEAEYTAGCYNQKVTIMPDMLVSCSMNGILNSHWNGNLKDGEKNDKPDKPLANTKVFLKPFYVFKNDNGTEEILTNPTSYLTSSYGGVSELASAVTDAAGQFKFKFNVFSDGSSKQTFLGFTQMYQGKKLYRVLRVIVDNKYYFSPDNSFVVDGGYDYDIGTITSNVREARFEGRVISGSMKPLGGQDVYLCRKNTTPSIPKDEGNKSSVLTTDIKDPDGQHYTVISQAETKDKGIFSFTRLAAYTGKADREYFIMVMPDETKTENYSTIYPVALSAVNSCNDCFSLQNIEFNSKQPIQLPLIVNNFIVASALPPTIRGVLHPASNMAFTTLTGAQVMLFEIPDTMGLKLLKNTGLGFGPDMTLSDKASFFGIPFFEDHYAWKLQNQQITTGDGKFVFENLPANKRWVLWIKKSGFLDEVKPVGGAEILPYGQQRSLFIDLRLPVPVMVKVVEAGSTIGVPAKIIVGQNYSWEKTKGCEGMAMFSNIGCEATAALKCPYGKVKLYIYPENMDLYRADTVEIEVHGPATKTIEVSRKSHHIEFIVSDKTTGKTLPFESVRLINANVKNFKGAGALQGNGEMPLAQNAVGAWVEFESNAKDFDFLIFGADNTTSFTAKKITVHSDAAIDDFTTIEVSLDPAASLSGFVKSGNKPVAGAKVFVDIANAGVSVETTSNADGSYVLKGIPMKEGITIFAAKSNSNYIGDKFILSFAVNTGGGGGQNSPFQIGKNVSIDLGKGNYSHDFVLTECSLDISSLLGFPIEVTSFKSTGNNQGKISGRFVNIASNSVFKTDALQSLPFIDVAVKGDVVLPGRGMPSIIPSSLPVYTSSLALPVTIYGKSIGVLAASNSSGIKVNPVKKQGGNDYDIGEISGQVMLDGNSFPTGIQFNSRFMKMRIKGSNDIEVAALTSNRSSPSIPAEGFNVLSKSGTNLKFNLFGRYPNAEADKEKTFFKDDKLLLALKLHTKLNNIEGGGDIELSPGILEVTPEKTSDFTGQTSPISFSLGQWSMSSAKWSLTKNGGLVLNEGTINAGISVPFKNMIVTYTDLMYGEYDIKNLKLAGLVNLQVKEGSSVSFGFDKGLGTTGAWSLSVLPGANANYCSSFGGLPGMKQGQTFFISSIRLFSKGDKSKVMLLNDASPITINQVAAFSPSDLDVGTDYIKFRGSIDFGIPQLVSKTNFTLKYHKGPDGNIKSVFEDDPGEFKLKTNGVDMTFSGKDSTYKFEDGLLELNGTLKDEKDSPSKYLFGVKLRKTPVGTEVKTIGENRFYFQSGAEKGLEKVIGSMVASDKAWSDFSFEGDLFGMGKGVKDAGKHVKMKVKGEIVAEPGNKVGVEGVSTPMGDMSFVYDMAQGAFVGTAHVEADLGATNVISDLEVMMGSERWYFYGKGKIIFNVPDFWVKEASTAFWVGSTSGFSSNIKEGFKEFTLDHTYPSELDGNFVGIITAMGYKMPVPKIPQFEFNLKPVVDLGIDHEIGGNVILSTDFSKLSIDNPIPHVGMLVNGYVYIRVYAGASVGIGCFALSIDVKQSVQIAGSFDKDKVEINGHFGMCLGGSASVGGGCCTASCEDVWVCPCVTGGVSVHFCMGASVYIVKGISLGTKDADVGFSISKPQCGSGDCGSINCN